MSFDMILPVTLAGLLSSIAAGLIEIFVFKKYRKPETLEIRINKLSSALKESSRLV